MKLIYTERLVLIENGILNSADADAAPSVGACAALACLLEASVFKVGNVHPRASFADLDYGHFVTSAVLIGPILETARTRGVGDTILAATRTILHNVRTNTSLGTMLLLAPLAAAPSGRSLREAVADVLAGLDVRDTQCVYAAIRAVNPGGLGSAAEADVQGAEPPARPLVEVMRLATKRDLVARQFTNGFHEVFEDSARQIEMGQQRGWSLSQAILVAQLRLLGKHADSLIERKLGPAMAEESRSRALTVLESEVGSEAFCRGCASLDDWLRGDGNRRNPGTTADLLAAGLFVLLREGRLEMDAVMRTIATVGSKPGV